MRRSCVPFFAASFAVSLIVGVISASPTREGFTFYVSNERSGDVSVIDGSTLTETARWRAGKRPRGIHLTRDGKTLLVAVSGSPRLGPGTDPARARSETADKSADGIAVIDALTGRFQRKLSVGSDPEEFAISADGQTVFVSNEDESSASAWTLASGENVFTAAVSEEPEGVAVHPTRPEVYVTCETLGDVFVLDPTGKVLACVRVGGRPRSVAFGRDGKLAYVPIEGKSELAVIDTGTRQLVFSIPIRTPGALPMDAVTSNDGRELFVSTGRGNSVEVVDLARRTVVASIPVGHRPWGIALSPDGRTLFTANGASNDISVVDVTQRKEIKRVPVGDGPWGVAVGPSLK